jgi:hypothetical protein
MFCKHCGFVTPSIFEETPHLSHHGKLLCENCGSFKSWQPKPDRPAARRRSSSKDLVGKYGKGYCVSCLRMATQLTNKQVLHGHHIIEYDHGGTDDRENVLILCTACHEWMHWARRTLAPNNDPVPQEAAEVVSK